MPVAEHLLDEFLLFSDPLYLFSAMTNDIRAAQKRIYLQTFKFANDIIGQKFRDELTKKAKEGVEIVILIDSWGGSGVSESFFSELIKCGGKVNFFRKIKFSLDMFSANHRRNHRKLLIIDSAISYIGSANFTAYCLNWRECTLRIKNNIALKFEKIFLDDYAISNKFYQNKKQSTRVMRNNDIQILRDVPSNINQPVKNKIIKLIDKAKNDIYIETPYFLPTPSLRKSLFNAAKRGVNIYVIIPLHSDVTLFDILRDRYLGKYFKNNIKIKCYMPNNLHAKVLLVDNEKFLTGSSNFDYRSFRFMHEINIAGENKDIVKLLSDHVNATLNDCEDFDFEKWEKRHPIIKIIELLLVPIRHIF